MDIHNPFWAFLHQGQNTNIKTKLQEIEEDWKLFQVIKKRYNRRMLKNKYDGYIFI